MSDLIQEQQEILENLYNIMVGSSPQGMVSAQCRFSFSYGHDDGSYSVGERFRYLINKESVSAVLDKRLAQDIVTLIPRLHKLMKTHTGGEWTAFTLFIEEDGSVRTKFEYPESDDS